MICEYTHLNVLVIGVGVLLEVWLVSYTSSVNNNGESSLLYDKAEIKEHSLLLTDEADRW